MQRPYTLLVALAHPDDEIGAAGTMLTHRARGDRVVLVWLTRGEMTEAFGPVPAAEVMARREAHGREAGRVLGIETRFLDFPDTRLVCTPDASRQVAAVIAEVKPDAVVTFGDAWSRGLRHPDHQACGQVVRSAITMARIQKIVSPVEAHREFAPVFTYRGIHSPLPSVALDVESFVDQILELGKVYFDDLQFPDPDWVLARLAKNAEPWGLRYAECFDAWETKPGLVSALCPAEPSQPYSHPVRT